MTLPLQLLWFTTSLLVILVSFLYARQYKSQIRAALEGVRASQIQASDDIGRIIRDTLSPRVYSRSGRRNVNREAAELVRKAAAEEVREDRFLTIIGAPSMATASEPALQSAGEPAVINEYERALKDCPELTIKRYIALPKVPEVKARRPEFRVEYITWLKKQMETLNINDKYRLVDVVRAPQYGTNLAKFITKQSVMEIAGKGDGAITITETTIAKNILQAAVEAIEGRGYTVRNPPVVYTHGGDLSGLADLISSLEAIPRDES